MTLVSCQERDKTRGVSNWDIFPWPPLDHGFFGVSIAFCVEVIASFGEYNSREWKKGFQAFVFSPLMLG